MRRAPESIYGVHPYIAGRIRRVVNTTQPHGDSFGKCDNDDDEIAYFTVR